MLLLLPSDLLSVIVAACTVFELPTLAATCQQLERMTGERRRKIAVLGALASVLPRNPRNPTHFAISVLFVRRTSRTLETGWLASRFPGAG